MPKNSTVPTENRAGKRKAPASVLSVALRVPDAARYLSVSEPTIWRLLKAGSLPRVHLAGCTVIPRAALDALLSSQECAA